MSKYYKYVITTYNVSSNESEVDLMYYTKKLALHDARVIKKSMPHLIVHVWRLIYKLI